MQYPLSDYQNLNVIALCKGKTILYCVCGLSLKGEGYFCKILQTSYCTVYCFAQLQCVF